MNTYFKSAVLGLLVFGAGGAAGFFVAKNLLEKHYQELAQEEIDDVKAYFKNKYEPGKELSTAEEKEEKEESEDNNNYRKIVNKYQKPDLHELVSAHEEDEEDEDEENEDDEDEEDPEMRESPYLLSYEEYTKPIKPYENVELYYYRFDDVVCNGNDVILTEPEDILGWDWMKELETKTTAFVRNERFGSDYEIHLLNQSYVTEVGSKLETDKEKHYRRIARTKKVMDDSSDEYMESEKQKEKKPYVRKSRTKNREKEDEE